MLIKKIIRYFYHVFQINLNVFTTLLLHLCYNNKIIKLKYIEHDYKD